MTESDLKNIIIENVNNSLRRLMESLNNFDSFLYHNTSVEGLLQIISTNTLGSNYHRGYNKTNTHNGICFTRNKNYNPYTYYYVRLTFDANKIFSTTRNLKLIPYKDPEYAYLDEYEERLVSSNNKPFVLENVSDLVTEVTIFLDRICQDIVETDADVEWHLDILSKIVNDNIFGDKLKFVNNEKEMRHMSLEEACNYIETACEDEDSYQVYCVEYYDVTDESWQYSEYTRNRNQAITTAKTMFEENGIPTRVTFGDYDGQEYKKISIVQKFGDA